MIWKRPDLDQPWNLPKSLAADKKTSLLVTLAYMVGVFLLSSIPATHESGRLLAWVPSSAQNLLHIPAFGLLALLWILTLRAYGFTEHQSTFGAIVITLAYSAGVELYQAFVPGRFASVMDLALDLAGVALCVFFYQIARLTRFSARNIQL